MKFSTKLVLATFFISIFQWYDLFIFIALFPTLSKLFFSIQTDSLNLLLSVAFYGLLFIPRLFGASIMGYFGDIKGNKKVFVYGALLMSLTSCVIGFLPTQYSIGIFAPYSLVLLRCLQGFALGACVGGDESLLIESNNPKVYKTKYWLQAAPIMGLLLSICIIKIIKKSIVFGVTKDEVTGFAIDHFSTEYGGWRLVYASSSIILLLVYFLNKTKAMEALPSTSIFKDVKFFTSSNIKKMCLLILTIGISYSVMLYTIQFFSTMFLAQACNLKPNNVDAVLMWAFLLSLPLFALANWFINKVQNIRWVIIMSIALATLSYKFVFIKIQDLTAVKYKIELLDMKETQIKYLPKPNSSDTLKKIVSYHLYDDATKATMTRIDTLFAAHYKKYSPDKHIIIESEISSYTFVYLIFLLLIPILLFALVSIAISQYLSYYFHTGIRYRAYSLFYTISYSFVFIILFLSLNFYKNNGIKSFEQEATFTLNSIILIGILSFISILLYFIQKNKSIISNNNS